MVLPITGGLSTEVGSIEPTQAFLQRSKFWQLLALGTHVAVRNPVSINFPRDSEFEIICESRAHIYQQVTVLQADAPLTKFVADHDDMPMRLPDGTTSFSHRSDEVPTLSLLFEYSDHGPNGPFKKSRVTYDPNEGPVLAVASLQTETPGPLTWTMKLYACRRKTWSEVVSRLFFTRRESSDNAPH
jgi:hypothetical protein